MYMQGGAHTGRWWLVLDKNNHLLGLVYYKGEANVCAELRIEDWK